MKFIVGIGNPGGEYERTRHNVGFRVVDALKDRPGAPYAAIKWKNDEEFKALVVPSANTFLLKPLTYVNNSGATISAVLQKYGCANQDFLIVCDDVNLDFGKLRLRQSGSSGGHHGLEDIIDPLSEDFPRLRVGIRNDRMPKDLASFVLQRFDPEEEKLLGKILEKAALVCETWANENFGAAMNQLSKP